MKTAMKVLDNCEIGVCWRWLGSHNRWGYGQMRIDGKSKRVHRVVWEGLVGPIPDGLVVDHICRVRDCVNPDHLRVVTQAENLAASPAHGIHFDKRWQAHKTHCPAGHPYAGSNLYMTPSGRRECRICRRAHKREWNEAHR